MDLKYELATDSRMSWFILANCFLISMMNLGYLFSTGMTYILLQESLSVTREEASLPINVMCTSYFFCGVMTGPLLYFLKIRKSLLLASIVGGAGCLCCYAAPLGENVQWLTVGMSLRGFGMSLVRPITMQCVSARFSTHRAKALMIMFFTNSVAGLTFPFIAREAAIKYGLRGSWLIDGCVILQSSVFVMFSDWKSPPSKKEVFNNEIPIVSNKLTIRNRINFTQNIHKFTNQTLALLKNPRVYLLIFGYCSVIGPSSMQRLIIVDFGKDTKSSDSVSLNLLAYLSVGEMIGRVICAFILDKKIVKYQTSLWVSYLFYTVTFVALPLSRDYLLVAVALLSGVGYSFVTTTIMPMYSFIGTETVATVMGISQLVLGSLVSTIPKVIGFFRDNGGSYNHMIFVASGCTAFASLVFCISHKFKVFNEH